MFFPFIFDIPKVKLRAQGMFPEFLLDPQVTSFRVSVVAAPKFPFPSAIYIELCNYIVALHYTMTIK